MVWKGEPFKLTAIAKAFEKAVGIFLGALLVAVLVAPAFG